MKMKLLPFLLLLLSATGVQGLQATAARCSNEPKTRVDCYPSAPRFPNASEELCVAQGCCWKPLDNGGIPCAFDDVRAPSSTSCAMVAPSARMACRNPRFAAAELLEEVEGCHSAGCCFDDDAKTCFQPFFEGYELVTLDETDDGWRGTLVLRRFERGPFANDLAALLLHVVRESPTRVRVRISDPAFQRYEVPDLVKTAEDEIDDSDKYCYKVFFTHSPFGIAVARRDTGEVLFNSTPPVENGEAFNGLVFENQFIEFSTQLNAFSEDGEGPALYGLGDRLAPLQLNSTSDVTFPLFARGNNSTSKQHSASVHPMYLQICESGQAHGVFVRSSNAMEAVVQRDTVTFRLTGGIVDFVVIVGPTPDDVMGEYSRVIGRPEIPPYWALGFHVGSGRDRTVMDAASTVERIRRAGVPMDTYWLGSEYMNNSMPLTLDGERFPVQDIGALMDDLHFNGQYLVALQVPTVVNRQHASANEDDRSLKAFDEGDSLEVFVKGMYGEKYAEKFVSGHWSVFVDFFHPNASAYWRDQLEAFYDHLFQFDGVWLEHNEPSSSCDRVLAGKDNLCASTAYDEEMQLDETEPSVIATPSPAPPATAFIRSPDVSYPFDPFRQPFVPGQTVLDSGILDGNLNSQTLPLSVSHYNSMHYNVHSLYGLAQTRTTRKALDKIIQQRSLIASRSTFPGSGAFAGHTLQAFEATWEDLRLSIASTLRMNMFGIPFVGPNVGGFAGNLTPELFLRWLQAASFFPLLRYYSNENAAFTTPVDFDEATTNIVRATLLQRYKYLPHMYTLFYQANVKGYPVVRPVGFEFPSDALARRAEFQYLLGRSLMVTPVTEEKSIVASVYYPNATWFDAEDGRLLFDPTKDRVQSAQLFTPLAKLQLHIRGGFIVPTQQPQTTTAMARHEDFVLVAALESAGVGVRVDQNEAGASGELYIDDGITLDPVENERYSLARFTLVQNSSNSLVFKSRLAFRGYDGPEMRLELATVKIYGVRGDFHSNSSIMADLLESSGSSIRAVKADYFAQSSTLVLSRLQIPIGDEFTVQIKATNEAPDGKDHGHHYERESESDQDDRKDYSASDKEAQKGDEGEGKQEGETTGREGEQRPEKEQTESKFVSKSTIVLISAAVAAAILAGGCVFIYARRRPYNPIS